MQTARKAFLLVLVLILVAALGAVGWFYWRLWRALPTYEGEVRLAGVAARVTVLRDARGVPHVSAETLEDLLFAQGYLTAEERFWQMELLRRTARGEASEILGRAFLESDKSNRILGLGDVAERAAESLDSESRTHLEAYARGVNAYLETHRTRLPLEFLLLRYEPRPWTPADSLAVALNLYKLLSTSWPGELLRAKVTEKVGPALARDLYVSRSAWDHPLAEPGERPRRRERRRVYLAGCRHPASELTAQFRPWLQEGVASEAQAAGSNNWVVAGARTASGLPLLANDPHLPHMLPAVWFAIHLQSPELDVAGVSLPGLPFVVLGHNQRIAWGMTNLYPDVQDLYLERFHPTEPYRYRTPTGWQTAGRRLEMIQVRGEADVEVEALRTRHGPIVHDDGGEKLALRWTALEPEMLSFPFYEINRAQNWEEFRAALSLFSGPTQNVVYADVEGNIGYYGAGHVPIRRRGRGEVPVAGEVADFDWVRIIPFPEMPQAFNPPMGILATANNRVVPDGYSHYLTDRWDAPYRVARRYDVLENQTGFRPQDFLQLQGDLLSQPDLFLAQSLVATASAETTETPETPALREAVEILRTWDGQMRAHEAAPLLTTETRRVLLENLLRPRLGDDWDDYSWSAHPLFLENVLRERPARWLPEAYADYDALLRSSLATAVERLRAEFPSRTLRSLRWGERLQVRFRHPLGARLPRWFDRWFNLGGPQSGGRYAVKQMTRGIGPSMRMVIDLADFDQSVLNITVGQSGHPLSPHYRDQFRAWDAVESFPFPFSDAAVAAAARYRLHLLPVP
ncbi:MAG: penicillin acylase family protein [Acidobacteria bacterium]|nr:penicillin acylase family protein [Acidobacteriota bacterium]